jgi:hypothetical protein
MHLHLRDSGMRRIGLQDLVWAPLVDFFHVVVKDFMIAASVAVGTQGHNVVVS